MKGGIPDPLTVTRGLTVGTTNGRVSLSPSFSPAEGVSAYGVYFQPTIICAGGSTYSALFAGLYVASPQVTMNGGKVTDGASLFIQGAPAGITDDPGFTSNRALYVYAGNSVIRDRLGVGPVTIPDANLTVLGPGNSNWTARIQPNNAPAPYGLFVEGVAGASGGYPLFQVGPSGGASTWLRIDSGADGKILIDANGMVLGESGDKVGFLGATPIVRPSGVAVTAAGIHAALVSLGLIAA